MKAGILGLAIFFAVTACTQDKNAVPTGTLTLHFQYQVNGSPAVFNSMQYTNAAGNRYEITNVQWFISDMALINKDGKTIDLSPENPIHYIDSDMPQTGILELNGIPPGEYRSIMFVFGIRGEKNIPDMYTDPPESNMMWPYAMGGDFGGYHYMKFNGFWENPSGQRTPFNCHLGVGQIYDQDGNITGYVQNWFEVFLPRSSFIMSSGSLKEAYVNMNLESWFETPHIFDWNFFGGAIMNNQEAMGMIRDNGSDVFSIDFVSGETN